MLSVHGNPLRPGQAGIVHIGDKLEFKGKAHSLAALLCYHGSYTVPPFGIICSPYYLVWLASHVALIVCRPVWRRLLDQVDQQAGQSPLIQFCDFSNMDI